jgi:hypothetical protein
MIKHYLYANMFTFYDDRDFQVEGNATDFEFWDLILGPSHELFFLNIERCTQGAAELHMKGKLVPRFIIGGSVRYDRVSLEHLFLNKR